VKRIKEYTIPITLSCELLNMLQIMARKKGNLSIEEYLKIMIEADFEADKMLDGFGKNFDFEREVKK